MFVLLNHCFSHLKDENGSIGTKSPSGFDNSPQVSFQQKMIL